MSQTIRDTKHLPSTCPQTVMKKQRKIMATSILLTELSNLHKLTKAHPILPDILPPIVHQVLQLPEKKGIGNPEAKET